MTLDGGRYVVASADKIISFSPWTKWNMVLATVLPSFNDGIQCTCGYHRGKWWRKRKIGTAKFHMKRVSLKFIVCALSGGYPQPPAPDKVDLPIFYGEPDPFTAWWRKNRPVPIRICHDAMCNCVMTDEWRSKLGYAYNAKLRIAADGLATNSWQSKRQRRYFKRFHHESTCLPKCNRFLTHESMASQGQGR